MRLLPFTVVRSADPFVGAARQCGPKMIAAVANEFDALELSGNSHQSEPAQPAIRS